MLSSNEVGNESIDFPCGGLGEFIVLEDGLSRRRLLLWTLWGFRPIDPGFRRLLITFI